MTTEEARKFIPGPKNCRCVQVRIDEQQRSCNHEDPDNTGSCIKCQLPTEYHFGGDEGTTEQGDK
jgi:hypothetical protein